MDVFRQISTSEFKFENLFLFQGFFVPLAGNNSVAKEVFTITRGTSAARMHSSCVPNAVTRPVEKGH